MAIINSGNISELHSVSDGEVLRFPVAGGYRRVRFELISSAAVAVYATHSTRAPIVDQSGAGELVTSAPVLVAASSGAGSLAVEFVVTDAVHCDVAFMSDGGDMSLRTFDQPQVIPRSESPAFTTLEPHSGGSSEFDRMLMLSRINFAQLEAQREQLRREAQADRDATAALLAAAQPPAPPVPAAPDGASDA